MSGWPVVKIAGNRSLSIFAALLMSFDCSSASLSASEYSKPQGWGQVVEAARKEGVVNVYGRAALDLVKHFQKAFPEIRVKPATGQGFQLVSRIALERRAGRYLADLLIGPGATAIPVLKTTGALAPIEPALVLPEVLDPSAWLDNHLWWLDAAKPYTVLAFVGNMGSPGAYNPQLVNAAEFKSYWDFLNPKWKGKMVIHDVRQVGGGGQTFMRFWYPHPGLGPKFIERLFSEMDVTPSRDHRQMNNWVAKGRFPIGLFVSGVPRAMEQGLPIAEFAGDQFKEGGPIGYSGGSVSLIDKGPNPNAAKVFLNWLLSREGQIAWQKQEKNVSLRIDIPKDDFPPAMVPKPGVRYVNVSHEDFVQLGPAIRNLVTKALEK